MKRLLLFLLLLISNLIFAQQQRKLDSLKTVLAKLPAEGRSFASDTTRVRVLCEMGGELINSDESLKYLREGIQISEEVLWNKGVANALNLYGRRIKKQGNFIKSNEYFFKALAAAEKSNDIYQIAYSYQNIGDVCLLTEKYFDAISYYNKSQSYYVKINNFVGILSCNNNIAIVYYKLSDFDKSLYFYKKCLELNKKFKVLRFDAYSLNSIGVLYKSVNQRDSAMSYIKKALVVYDKLNGEYYEDKALSLNVLSELYYFKKDYKNAIDMAFKAINTNKNATGENKFEAYNTLFRIYEAKQDYKQAFKYQSFFLQLKDSLNKREFDERTKFAESLYKNEKQETEIEYLGSIRNILIIGVSIFLILGLFLFRNNHLLQKKNVQINQQKFEIEDLNKNLEQKVEERTSELQKAYEEIKEAMLKGQVIERQRVASELHDNLGSTLSALKFRFQAINADKLTEKEQKIFQSIMNMMSDAYSEVRNISHNLLPAELETKGLKAALERIVHDINLSEKINITLNIKDEAIPTDKKTSVELYSICMELLNNIIKHSKATQAIIQLTKTDTITLTIEDNGVGFDEELYKTEGMGMKNLQKRVDSLGGSISIASKIGKGSKFNISIKND